MTLVGGAPIMARKIFENAQNGGKSTIRDIVAVESIIIS